MDYYILKIICTNNILFNKVLDIGSQTSICLGYYKWEDDKANHEILQVLGKWKFDED